MEENGEQKAVNGRDPATGQFVEGYKGGPGRPAGRRNYAQIWADVLNEVAEANKMTPEEADNLLTKVAYKKASTGDYNFYRDLRDRIHGKPLQSHSVEGAGLLVPQIVVFGENDPLYKQLKESQKLQ